MRHLLHKIAATITQQSREVISPVWSGKSWTHNVFRVYEYLFGRREGIRPEGYADCQGNVYSYSWENYIAVIESIIREACKFRLPRFSVIYLPQLQLVGLAQEGISPFRFAIAFDNQNSTAFASVTSQSFSLTITGSNILLLGQARSGSGSDTVTGMTYNSVALSNGTSVVVPTDRGTCVKYLKGAATGANTFASTCSPAGMLSSATSYTGALQTGGIDASTTNTTTSATSLTTSLTTVANNCWVFGYSATNGGSTLSAGTGETLRINTPNNDLAYDSGAPVTPAGSYSMTTNLVSAGPIASNQLSFAPVAASVVLPFKTLLGVGI